MKWFEFSRDVSRNRKLIHLKFGSNDYLFFVTSNDQVLGEVPEVVKTGLWVGDCFIYTSSLNRLNYYVGGEIVTIAHLDRYNTCT